MTPEEKLTRELKELKRLTGISFSIDENDTADTADIAEKIKLLSDAFREKNSRTAFFKKLLSGELEVSRIYEGASRLHLPVESPARIYVIETENVNDESALMVLRQIGAGRNQDHLVPMDGKRIAVIKSVRNNESEEDALMLAHMFVDMLNAEAMVRARCAFGECIPSLAAMPEAYRGKNSRTAFFKKLLSGELEVSRIYEGASRLHLPVEGPARIYVIETENVNDESAVMVLRQIGAGRTQDHLVPMDGRRIALIRAVKQTESEEDALNFAHMLVDMLNAEAMVRARCAFGEVGS